MSRGPRPLEVVAAEPAGDIDHLSNEVETWDGAGFHRLLRERVGIDAAKRDFGFRIAECTRRVNTPGLERVCDYFKRSVGKLGERLRPAVRFRKALCEAPGQEFFEE